MYAIQWYDPWDFTPSGKARKDGKPEGKFESKVEAERHAEYLMIKYGINIPYKIVTWKP